MRQAWLAGMGVSCLALAAGAASVEPSFGVTRALLDNGLTVLIREEPSSALVTVAAMYAAGARNEAAGFTGLAHYVEHMNFRATRGFPGHEVTEAITRIGGRWSGYTWIDQTYYAETVPRQAFERMLDLEAERMTNALHDPVEFQQERSSVIAELHSYDDPQSLLYDAVLAASFEIHPYRNNTIGWLSDVEAVTRDDAYRFYRRFYHPRNAVLTIVGGVDAASALQAVRQRFGPITASGDSGEVRTLEPLQTGQRRLVVRKPSQYARLLLAFRAPALAEPDFPAMVLFDALLAGGKGAYFTRDYAAPAATPLRRATTGRGLATEAGTDWQASRYPYVYTVAASAPAERDLPALESALFSALAEAGSRSWSEQEIAAALRQIRIGWALDLDAQANRAHQLAFFEVSGGYAHLFELPARIAKVTREDLTHFARERLQPYQATVGWFVPAAAAAAPPAPAPTPLPPAAVSAREPPVPSQAPLAVSSPAAFTLENGVRVVLAPSAGSELVVLRARVDAGSRYDPEGLAGLSAIATDWLATPLAGDPAGTPEIQWTLHEEPESATNLRFIELAAVGLAEDMPALLELFAGRLARDAPSETDWRAVCDSARDRAGARDASDTGALRRSALRELFPAGAPLAAPPWGEPLAFGAMEPRALRAFLAGHVTPSRTTLLVSGGFEPVAARRALAATLGRWRAASVPVPRPRPVPPPQTGSIWTERALERRDKAQNRILVVWPGDRSQPWDRAATEVLLYLLGETGYAGRLGRALVEPGLVYSVYTTLEEPGVPGFLMIRTASAPRDTSQVLRRIRGVIEQAAGGGFTQAELDEALAYRRGKAARAAEGAQALAASLLEKATRADASDAGTLSLAHLNDTASRLLLRGAPVALVAGPGES